MNPATASLEYLRMLRGQGVDRISLGAQSFERSELSVLERHHEPSDVPRSLELAREADFSRLNIDLIYAIPGQSLQSWSQTLEQAISLQLTHYSCYGLTYEPNTPLAVKKRLGLIHSADETLELEMLHHTRSRLAAIGCPAYEISNYAARGQECLHNLMYWTGGSYIGLGPSAASHVEGHRFKSRPHLGEWETAIAGGQLPAADVEHLSPLQRAGERVMLELRLARGLNFDDYSARTGLDARLLYSDQLAQLGSLGLLEVDPGGFRLTEAGLDVADSIAAQFVATDS